jgi:hypothetical protein
MKRLSALLALVIAPLSIAPLRAATIVDREFTYPADRFALKTTADGVVVELEGAAREFLPGRPDLPQIAEQVELPAGMRVARVEVTGVDRELWRNGVRVLPAQRVEPGLGSAARTTPDPQIYQRGGAWPGEAAELSVQGSMRGRNIAFVRVHPARWDPRSGRLERATRVRVRLHLEPSSDPDVVKRERIVPEFEDGAVAEGAPSGIGDGEFKALQIPSVLGSPVAYVIVTGDDQAAEFQRLADWKTQAGVPAVVRTMSFVRQQYPGGVDDAERVRLFIRDAYARWGTKWVLLGGDTEVIPARLGYTSFYSGEFIAADLYYSCVDGNWNADGDSLFGEGFKSLADPGDNCDLLPDVYVGRAPTVNAADAQHFVDKTLLYLKTPPGNYENSVLFLAEVLFPQEWTQGDPIPSLDGAELAEEVVPFVTAVPGLHAARLYQNHLDPRWDPGAIELTKARAVDSLDVGYNLAVHIGHGFRNVMSVGDANLETGDALGMSNGTRLTNIYAINCTSNAIDFPSIGEAFLHSQDGAVTNIGSTRFDFPTAGRHYQVEFFKLIYQQGITALGEAQAKQKLPFVPFSSYDGVNRWTEMTLLMLGDPELRLYTERPRTLTVTHAGSIPVTDTTFAVGVMNGGSPVVGARVTAYKAGEDYRIGTTNGSGNVTLNFRPGSTGTFTLTVTAFNCRPYQANVTVGAAAGARLAEQGITIDDDASGGTSGDGNGAWDAGEVVDLTVPVKNNGGASATGVTGRVSTPDGLVTIVTPTVSYGTIAAGATANGSGAYRLSIPYTAPDQREIPLVFRWVSGSSSWADTLRATLRAPEPRHYSHVVVDLGGNSDQRPDPGETISYSPRLRNMGTGTARGVTAVLRRLDGLSTVTDSTSTVGDIAYLAEVQGSPFSFSITDTLAKFELRVSTSQGLIATYPVDVRWPRKVIGLVGRGSGTSVDLGWAARSEPDLFGYNVYRGLALGGPYTRVNLIPSDREALYLDAGLTPLTQYFYKVSAVDSSGNESVQSDAYSISTSPPNHVFWPHETGQRALSPVALEFLYQGSQMDIAMASDMVYLWHADGSAPVDADQSSATSGDFSVRGQSLMGQGFRSGPSIGDIDGGQLEVVAVAWDSAAVYAFDLEGQMKPGFPVSTIGANLDQRRVWSGAALGDLDGNGTKEIVFGSNGYNIYAVRGNGQEWMDGDANPATTGVFKTLPLPFNYATPALADIDGNGQLDIVYASYEGRLYVWRPNGTDVPGFPVMTLQGLTGSPVVGYLDGPGDLTLEIVMAATNDSLYAFTNTGVRKAGWPVFSRAQGGADMQTTPALADMNNDGFLDVVHATSDGFIKVYNRNGTLQPLFNNVRYSTALSPASASSPVVADITGDGLPDVVMGDNNSTLTAISGATGQVLAGFPIVLPAEVYGTAGLCDCDQDGLSEIALAGLDGNVYLWDYDFPFQPSGTPAWPQFQHDARRTGLYSSPVFVDVQTPVGGGTPTAMEFSTPWPNPAVSRSRIRFAIPADQAGVPLEIAVHDLMGRVVKTLERGTARPGRHELEWDLRDASGSAVGAGVYFVRMQLGVAAQSRKLAVLP